MRKKIVLSLILILAYAPTFSQKKNKGTTVENYKFKTVIENPITSVKNQGLSGFCWSFSGLSFFESEILRTTGEEYDLSEMFVVSNAYYDRALKYVRMHGHLNFCPGSSFGDVLATLKTYGIVPENEMPGINDSTEQYVYYELDGVLKGIVSSLVENKFPKLSKVWKKGIKEMIATYLGESPQTFNLGENEYTPKSYLTSLGIDLNDYVDISSWIHHPFYQKMILEVPDNWRGFEITYNIPIEELIQVIDNAIENGYTIAWAGDISEDGFSDDGIAVMNNGDNFSLANPQELRQEAFDDYSTTDDHGMHIFGKAIDQNGNEFYMVKNSWGDFGTYGGIWYISKEYMLYKTTDIMLNKHAIPKNIQEKMGL